MKSCFDTAPTALLFILTSACSSSGGDDVAPIDSGVDVTQDAAPDAADASDASDSADANDASDAALPCPPTAPDVGTACSTDQLCSWGTDARHRCRATRRCYRGTWHGFEYEGECPRQAPSCPPSPPPRWDGGSPIEPTCGPDQLGLACVYDQVAYTCTVCDGNLCPLPGDGGVYTQWYQTALDPRCPGGTLPNYGGPCATPGLVCDYNRCADDVFNSGPVVAPWAAGVGIICLNGAWDWYNLSNGAPVCL
jgi:hypothetical protein